jgi:ribosome maturation factor RimP
MQSDPLKLDQYIEPVVSALGYEFWGYEFSSGQTKAYLRVYIDKQEGVTLDDCTRVSHQVSGVLDVEDPIRGSYTLEISSPGLDRPLFKKAHYQRFSGQRVKVRLKWQMNGRRNFTGQLQGLDGDNVIVLIDSTSYSFPLEAVDRARLVPEF